MKKHEWIIVCLGGSVIGAILGASLPLNFLKIKTDGLALDQLLTIIVTGWVGWYIPSKVSTIVENNRAVKSLLVDEILICITFIKGIKQKIQMCYTNNVISSNDKQEINLMFDEAELLIDNLKKQIDRVDQGLCAEAIDSYYNYWRFVTGGNFMDSSFSVVDDTFNKKLIVEHYKMEINFKRLAQNVQSYNIEFN